jgi:hypothetical protein
MHKAHWLALALALVAADARAEPDAFSAVRCDADVRKALIGRRMPGGNVADIQRRYENIGAKDLGSMELTDDLFLGSWRICGKDVALLLDDDHIRDVLDLPVQSQQEPQFIGICHRDGKQLSETFIGTLRYEKGEDLLAPVDLWEMQERPPRFAKSSVHGMRCERSGILGIERMT